MHAITMTPDKLVTIGVRRPARLDRGVETNPEIDALLAAGAPVAIGVSGGKDSCAAALATVEYLDAIGHTGPRVLIHADLGRVEWADSIRTCERLATCLGLELLVVRREAGDMMDRWLVRWRNNVKRYADLSCVKVILPWSTPAMRFCTSELKSAPMASALVKRFPGTTIVSASGVRREESADRSHAPTAKRNPRLENGARKTTGLDWNPIAEWTEVDVYAFCADRGFEMHEGYTRFGMSRISCAYCIMAKRSDLVASSTNPGNAAIYREMVDLEISSGFAFQGKPPKGKPGKERKSTGWLGDVAPQLLIDAQRAALAETKARAARREVAEARIPKHLLYTKGWPTVMPTAEEAQLIAEVRAEVAAALGIEVGYTEPQAVTERYASLMAENARREAAKNVQAQRKLARTTKSL